jgi:3-methyladenine DNA glycosylase AlkC
MQTLVEKLSKIEHGFKPIENIAIDIFKSNVAEECLKIADELIENDIYQARALGVFLLGHLASANPVALQIMRTKVSRDPSWQVQEILAKAFDQYCSNISYEQALPIIREWLADTNPNVCRAVTEGLRIWTSRPFFKENPRIAIELISEHKASDSEYLRKSVGNSLRDISKRHKNLVNDELSGWDLSDKRVLFTWKYVTKSKK